MHWYIPSAACWWPMAPKPPVIGAAASDAQAAVGVCCIYWQGKADGGAVPAPFPRRAHDGRRPYHHQSMAVVSKCALSRGPIKRTERPGPPRRFRFGSLLLVNHRPFSLCHSATNEPPVNVMWWSGETTLYTLHLRKNLLRTLWRLIRTLNWFPSG